MTDFGQHLPRIFKTALVCSAASTLGACAGPGRIAGAADPVGFCYRTLGIVDCYTTPEINRPPLVPPTIGGD